MLATEHAQPEITAKPVIKVGVIGFGTVGSGTISALLNNQELINSRTMVDIQLVKVADTDITTPRGVEVAPEIMTIDALRVVDDPTIDIVVELIGGIDPAKGFVIRALRNGKSVVTANKALLSHAGHEIFRIARENNAHVFYEASVGGGIPVMRTLEEGLVANRIDSIVGIVNGTTNFILTQMVEEGANFADVLKIAQEKGYAEADPTFDIGGIDAAHKLLLLAHLAYGKLFALNDVLVEGITEITTQDLEYADQLGYVIKHLAIAKLTYSDDTPPCGGQVELRVHPTLLRKSALLANVNGVFNAIYIHGNQVGPTLSFGQGAGDMATGSAVASDIVRLAQQLISDKASGQVLTRTITTDNPDISLLPSSEICSSYYLRLLCRDCPGVLSDISGVLGKNQISISAMLQKEEARGQNVPIIMMTSSARESDIQQAVSELVSLPVVEGDVTLIRVEDI